MIPGKLKLTPFTEGDEWEGIPSLIIQTGPEGGPYAAPGTTLTAVTMRFKKLGDAATAVVALSSADNEITIVDSAAWEISVPAQIIPALTAGEWAFQIKCTDDSTSGSPLTYISDKIQVLETV